MPAAGRVGGALDERHSVDVPGAVREDVVRPHLDDELRAFEAGQEHGIVVQGGRAVHPHAIGLLEVDEQQPDLGIHEHVAEAAEHPVAVVARECQGLVVDDPHEPGLASLV